MALAEASKSMVKEVTAEELWNLSETYPDGTAKTLRETDTLSGESVVPGFSCPVQEIFS